MPAVHASHTEPVPAQPTAADEPLLAWTIRLASKGRLAVVWVAVCAAAALGWLQFHSLLLAAAGGLMVFSAVAEYVLPIHYRLTEAGAFASYGLARLEMRWERVRSADWGDDFVRLSPFPAPSRLDAFRGIMLRVAPDGQPGCREDVRRIVGERAAIAAPAATGGQ